MNLRRERLLYTFTMPADDRMRLELQETDKEAGTESTQYAILTRRKAAAGCLAATTPLPAKRPSAARDSDAK